jgi:hypothetical protein
VNVVSFIVMKNFTANGDTSINVCHKPTDKMEYTWLNIKKWFNCDKTINEMAKHIVYFCWSLRQTRLSRVCHDVIIINWYANAKSRFCLLSEKKDNFQITQKLFGYFFLFGTADKLF